MTQLFEQFQAFRTILCLCPSCNDIHRLSDLNLHTEKKPQPTWLDHFEAKERHIQSKEMKFEEQRDHLREIARQKGRASAQRIFLKAISSSLNKLRLDPFDLKPIFNPVDLIAFRGMNKENRVNDILFVSKTTTYPFLRAMRARMRSLIRSKKYDWQVVRIDQKGCLTFE